MAARKYSEEDKAVALAALDAHAGNMDKASKFLGIPRSTLRFWKSGGAVNNAVAIVRQVKKGELADRLEELAHLLVEAIPNKIDEASLQQVATSLGIAVDKMQLLRSKPTEIIEDASLSNTERAARITTLLNNARTRGVGLAAGSAKVATA
jgi:transposase-like protein